MNIIRMNYEAIIESENFESYDNRAQMLFVFTGIIGNLVEIVTSGSYLTLNSIELTKHVLQKILLGGLVFFIVYFLNGAITAFISSKLGGKANSVESRIAHTVGFAPVIIFNWILFVLIILLAGVGKLSSTNMLTLISQGGNAEFIHFLKSILGFVTVGLTCYSIARRNRFGLIKAFISCYWYLLLSLPLGLIILIQLM